MMKSFSSPAQFLLTTLVAAVLLLPPPTFAQAPAANTTPPTIAGPAETTPTVAVPNTSTTPQVNSGPTAEIAVRLPRDLTPLGMFLAADVVVKAVMLGLVFASVVTWTIWFAKVTELIAARRQLRSATKVLSEARSLKDCWGTAKKRNDAAGSLVGAAETELRLSADALDPVGVKERIASRLERIEAAAGRRILRGTGILATIGATAPFVGLFGTVWGIMNSRYISPTHDQPRCGCTGHRRGATRHSTRPRRRHPSRDYVQFIFALDCNLSRAASGHCCRSSTTCKPRSRSG